MKCKRCGNSNRFLFNKIYCENCNTCYYCIKCAHISIFKLCDELKDNLNFTRQKVNYKLKYSLTQKQRELSDKICENILHSNIFINATCGAGKTEIVFEVVKRFINKNLNVAFISPRIEVTHEIYVRFNLAFNTSFGIITGEVKNYNGAMFFMTCNQLINYHNLFDLVIVDEADAFPLASDRVLENGIRNSLVNTGRIIKMSATPLKIDKNYIILELFERYHKHPIPIPIFKNYEKELFLEKISTGKWIVFFPTIRLLQQMYDEINDPTIIICHSKITNVSERLSSLSEQFVIFSTAILERGITLSNINVIVYSAHHENFTYNTLVQISGRVGRVAPYVTGEIILLGEYLTKSICDCIKYITTLNE